MAGDNIQLLQDGGFPLWNGITKQGVMDKEMFEYMLTHPVINQEYMNHIIDGLRRNVLYERPPYISRAVKDIANAVESKSQDVLKDAYATLSHELAHCEEDLDEIQAVRRTLHNNDFDYGDIDDTERVMICHVNYLRKKIGQKTSSRVCSDVVPTTQSRLSLGRSGSSLFKRPSL